MDTGIFDDHRYFDVFVEYAKASEQDICVRIEAFNRGPQKAELHILPHLWFRNTWAWCNPADPEPVIKASASGNTWLSLEANDRNALPPRNLRAEYRLGLRYLYAEEGGTPLFTFNETNGPRVFGSGALNRKPYVKDAFHS